MNDELAKLLKEAGFPQHYPWPCGCDGPVSCMDHVVIRPFYYPTLEEVIEWCGDGFLALGRREGKDGLVVWHARAHPRTNVDDCMADTPIEAAAMLGIALHSKV